MSIRQLLQFALGPIGTAALSLFIIPFSAWIFEPEDIGRISMLQIAVSFSLLLFTLGLDQAYVREFYGALNKPELFLLTLGPGAMLFFVFSIVLLALSPILASDVLYGIKSSKYSVLTLVCCASAIFLRFLQLSLRVEFKAFKLSLTQIIPKVILFAGLLGIYKLAADYHFQTLLYLHTIAAMSACIAAFYFVNKQQVAWRPQRIQTGNLGKLIKFSAPLMIGSIATAALTLTDRSLLRYFSTFSDLAVYSVAIGLAGMGAVFSAIFNTIWAPTLYKWDQEGKNQDKARKVDSFMLVLVVAFFCGSGLLSFSFTYLLPSEYAESSLLFSCCLAYPLLYVVGETASINISMSRKTLYSMSASIIAAICNLVGCYLLIPALGAAGAAIATAIASLVFLCLRVELSSRVLHVLPRRDLYIFSTLCIIQSIYVAYTGERVALLNWLLILILACYYFRSTISELYDSVLKVLYARKLAVSR